MKTTVYPKSYIQSSQSILASHVYVSDASLKDTLASNVFEFLNEAYKFIGGFKSFTGEDDFIDKSYLWYITYDGKFPDDPKDIDVNKILTVSVFKKKLGLKLVGMGNNRFPGITGEERRELKAKAQDAMRQQLKFVLKKGWAEVSGKMEALFKSVDRKGFIDPEYLKEAPGYEDIQILPDQLHYSRKLSNGDEVTKIAYGNIRF